MMTFSSGMLLGSKLTSIASNLVGTNTITPDVTTATPDVPTDVAGVTPDIPDITPDMSDVALDVTPDVDVFGYDDIVVGQGIEGADITTGYTNSINAVSGLDQVTLNTDIINDGNSIIERFVVVDDAGSILDSINTDGLSVQDLIDKGINPDNIAVDIRNATGDPRAWVSLDEMGIGRTL